MSSNEETFCIIPFVSVAVDPSLNQRLCCYALPGGINLSKEFTLENMWKSEVIEKARDSFLANSMPQACISCSRFESWGVTSKRIRSNEKWKSILGEKEYETITKGKLPKYPSTLDFRFSNKCNLGCRMCRPLNSSFLEKEYTQALKLNPNTKAERFQKSISELEQRVLINEPFWQDIEEKLPFLVEINLAGGEPTISSEVHRLLESIIRLGLAEKIRIRFNTNLVKLDKGFLELLKPLKKLRIDCSFDGINEVAEYQRYPCKWKSVEENFIKLMNHLPDAEIFVNSVVSFYSIRHLREQIVWFTKMQNHGNLRALLLEPVIYPTEASLKMIPEFFRSIILQEIESINAEFEKPIAAGIIVDLNRIASVLREIEPASSYERDQFFAFNETLDILRGQSLREKIPLAAEMADFLRLSSSEF